MKKVASILQTHSKHELRFTLDRIQALIGPNFFKECAEIVNTGGPPDIEKLTAVMIKYGLKPALPG
jgi:hypothetical protein